MNIKNKYILQQLSKIRINNLNLDRLEKFSSILEFLPKI